MSDSDKNGPDLSQVANALVTTACHHGYLRQQERQGLFAMAFGSARTDILMAALGSLRGGSSSPVVPVGTGWEFASAYGPLVRLAIFELTSGESDGRWSAFVTLFRHYFGRQIDPLLPSVYLAAVTHPQVLRTDAMCADAACLTRLLYSDADLLETLRDSGLMQ